MYQFTLPDTLRKTITIAGNSKQILFFASRLFFKGQCYVLSAFLAQQFQAENEEEHVQSKLFVKYLLFRSSISVHVEMSQLVQKK